MGCGSSKAVGVADLPNASDSGAANRSTAPAGEQAALEVSGDSDEGIPTLQREGTGLKFDVGLEAPKRKPPARFAGSGKSKTNSKKAIDERMEDAARRREEQTDAKIKALEAEDLKRRKARQGLEAKKHRAAARQNDKQKNAIQKRGSEISVKSRRASTDEKHKRARSRRHEDALQAASKLDTGGEMDDRMDGTSTGSDDEDAGETQEW